MITQDFINGYVSALNTLEEAIRNNRNHESNNESEGLPVRLDKIEAYNESLNQIKSLKESYKELIKKLND